MARKINTVLRSNVGGNLVLSADAKALSAAIVADKDINTVADSEVEGHAHLTLGEQTSRKNLLWNSILQLPMINAAVQVAKSFAPWLFPR